MLLSRYGRHLVLAGGRSGPQEKVTSGAGWGPDSGLAMGTAAALPSPACSPSSLSWMALVPGHGQGWVQRGSQFWTQEVPPHALQW